MTFVLVLVLALVLVLVLDVFLLSLSLSSVISVPTNIKKIQSADALLDPRSCPESIKLLQHLLRVLISGIQR